MCVGRGWGVWVVMWCVGVRCGWGVWGVCVLGCGSCGVCVCWGVCRVWGRQGDTVSLAPLYYPDTLVNLDTCLGLEFVKLISTIFLN